MNPTSDHAIDTLIASFPEVQFTPAQLGHINAEIQDTPIDRAAWDSTLKLYCQNYDPATRSYVPTKIGTLLKIFNEAKVKLEKDTNGTNTANRATTTDRLRATAESIASKYPTEAQLRENGSNPNGSQ